MANFTPGPWFAEYQGPISCDSYFILTEKRWETGSRWIATANGTNVGPATANEVLANACLIIAGPDMYAAIKDAEWGNNSHCPQCGMSRRDGEHQPRCLIANALAKAEGKEL